ncbi:MAG: YraN family protein [Clostridia bacterium]|nr:YraN family protein [Clostridia bacterium]
MSKTQTGFLGEDFAVQYLKKQKYKIIERNYKVLHKEIDVIAQDGETLVFVEVKTRFARFEESGLEAVTKHKQQNLIFASKCYMSKHHVVNTQVRFDVIEINQGEIHHIKNAFEL